MSAPSLIDISQEAPSKRLESIIRRAMIVASDSNHRMRHGAIVIKGGSVLSSGANIMKVQGDWIDYDHCGMRPQYSVHAEVRALKQVKKPTGCTVIVVRLDAEGNLAYSKPCPACQEYLAAAGVSKVYHS